MIQKLELKIGDKVLIIGKPKTMSKYSNDEYEKHFGSEAKIIQIYKHGPRNIVVEVGKYHALLYYAETDLRALAINKLDIK